jgi:hypothetical protein
MMKDSSHHLSGSVDHWANHYHWTNHHLDNLVLACHHPGRPYRHLEDPVLACHHPDHHSEDRVLVCRRPDHHSEDRVLVCHHLDRHHPEINQKMKCLKNGLTDGDL